MIFGFNTDIKVGNLVFHVQTEDRGEVNPTIDTTIYFKGRVLAKRATSYKEYFESPDFSPDQLKVMVEDHHKKWVAAVKNSEVEEMKEIQEQEGKKGEKKDESLAIELLNPSTLFHPTSIRVEAGVKRMPNGAAAGGALILVQFKPDGEDPVTAKGACDDQGKAALQLPLPKIGPKGADLLIQARLGEATAQLKFSLRPKQG